MDIGAKIKLIKLLLVRRRGKLAQLKRWQLIGEGKFTSFLIIICLLLKNNYDQIKDQDLNIFIYICIGTH